MSVTDDAPHPGELAERSLLRRSWSSGHTDLLFGESLRAAEPSAPLARIPHVAPRRPLLAIASVTAIVFGAACSEGTTATPAGQDGVAADVTVADSDLGEILTDADGNTLYVFLQDADGQSACTGDCATTWPPLVADGAPAGDGLDAELGTTDRDDGTLQVTVAGAPLYLYSGDAAPGDTAGQGLNEVWYVVSPSGEAVTGEGADRGGYGYGSGGNRYGPGSMEGDDQDY